MSEIVLGFIAGFVLLNVAGALLVIIGLPSQRPAPTRMISAPPRPFRLDRIVIGTSVFRNS